MRLRQLSGQVPGVEMDNALRNVILDEMEAACPLLSVAEFYQHAGSADAPRKNASAVGGTVRAIDAEYAGVATAPLYGATALKIYGDEILTDIAYERRGGDVNGEHLRQIKNFGKSLGRHLMNALINSEIDATNISGMKELCDATMLVTFDEDGDGTIPVGKSDAIILQQRLFLESLNNFIQSIEGGAQFLVMDYKTLNRIWAIALEFIRTATVPDALGGQSQLPTFNGVPIYLGGYTSSLSGLVIPHDETVADPVRTGCTSIYGGRYSEKADLTIATNVGVQVLGPTRGTTKINTVIDFDIDQVLLNVKALSRMQGIKIAQT